MERVASIDIGTNTILLLIAELDQAELKPLFEMETVVGLGKGLQRSGTLSPGAISRGHETLTRYLEHCRRMGVQQVFAVGTSALREAKNGGTFTKLAKEELGVSIEIISGEEEAKLSYLAVAKDLKDPLRTVLVIDVGGGSTECILGKGEDMIRWISLPMGSVRFTEQFLLSDPVKEEEWVRMEKEIRQSLRNIPRSEPLPLLVGVGGTATTLASVGLGLERFSTEKIHHFVLAKEDLAKQLSLYRSKTIEERKKIPGLFPNRADVILAGGAILDAAMDESHSPAVMISCHGIRYGLLYRKLMLEVGRQ